MTDGAVAVSVRDSHIVEKPTSLVGKDAGRWSRVFTDGITHPFDGIEWKLVDARILDSKGDVKFEQKGVEVPSWWKQTTVNIIADKYFRVVNGVREYSMKQVITRVSKTISRWAKEQGYFDTDDDAEIYEEELVHALLHQYGAFNSPVWFNIGVPGRSQVASACFISSIEDSLEGITEFQASELSIFKSGSGSGVSLSKLRSSYEKISSGSYTSGPLAFMKGGDAYAGAMKSGGATRNAAKMVVLDVSHPDILETKDGRPGFIRCKAVEEKRAKDLIGIGYSCDFDDPNSAYKSVNYQNANHSVRVSDAFMRAVISGDKWQTKEVKTGKPVNTYNAKDVMMEIAEAAWECGDPGLHYGDIINRWNTVPRVGPINASNPCSEFVFVDDTACNLCAISLPKFLNKDGKTINTSELEHSVRVFVTAQNAMINKVEYPTDKITKNSRDLRPIGLNYGGLGQLLMSMGIGYDSNQGRVIAARLASLMTGHAYRTSAKLAARVGPFPRYNENADSMMAVLKMHRDADEDIEDKWGPDPLRLGTVSAKLWRDVIALGEQYGYTIAQATLQAPLGTLSFFLETDTTGIEPAFSLVSYKSMVGGGYEKLVNGSVKLSLSRLGYNPYQANAINDYITNNGYAEDAPGLLDEHLSVFDCASPGGPSGRCLTPTSHLKMMSAIQPFMSGAQSKTVNLPETATVEDIYNIYVEGWKLGLKSIALYRNGSKWAQPLSANDGAKSEEVRVVAQRRHMPDDCVGHRHRFEIDGHKGYITMSEYPDGELGEVFLKLGKSGSTIGSLIDGFTRLLSIALQYGIPLDKLIRSFIYTKFEPSGMTSNSDIRFTDSMYDYLFKFLDLRYYNGENSGLSKKGIVDDLPKLAQPKDLPSMSLDAPPCGTCGAIMTRNGRCFVCTSCGDSSGSCS